LDKFIGTRDSFVFEIWLLIILVAQMTLLKKSGFDSLTEMMIENINQAFIRVTLQLFSL